MCTVSMLERGLVVVKGHGALCTCAVVAPYVREVGLKVSAGGFLCKHQFPKCDVYPENQAVP